MSTGCSEVEGEPTAPRKDSTRGGGDVEVYPRFSLLKWPWLSPRVFSVLHGFVCLGLSFISASLSRHSLYLSQYLSVCVPVCLSLSRVSSSRSLSLVSTLPTTLTLAYRITQSQLAITPYHPCLSCVYGPSHYLADRIAHYDTISIGCFTV